MNDEILMRLAELVKGTRDRCGYVPSGPGDRELTLLARLAAREGFRGGYLEREQRGLNFGVTQMHDYTTSPSAVDSIVNECIPLPPKRMLREEPVPDDRKANVLFRWRDGRLEAGVCGAWGVAAPIDSDDLELMRHAVDLASNPYTEVPDDGT